MADGWFYFCWELLTPKHFARDGLRYRGPVTPHSLGDAVAAGLAAISCAWHAGGVRAGPLWRGVVTSEPEPTERVHTNSGASGPDHTC